MPCQKSLTLFAQCQFNFGGLPQDGPDNAAERETFLAEKHLTPREVLTLDLLTCEGLQDKEIADRLNYSLPVAEKILRNIYKKLNVHRRLSGPSIWRDYLV